MKIKDYLIRGARKSYRILSGKKFLNPECIVDREVSNQIIYDLLSSNSPCMVSRFGTVELNCVANYQTACGDRSLISGLFEYVTGNTHTPWWNEAHLSAMNKNAGIFPAEISLAERFSKLVLNDVPLIDVLGSFQYYEKFMPLSKSVVRVQLETLYPFFVTNPWTKALKGKRVLVIHPFESSIKSQYQRRNTLFENQDVLPDFELMTLRAVQSIAGQRVPFNDWFEALHHMQGQLDKLNFDVALIGCGAYGMPLAAYVKRMGKQAVHLGGGTQLLFGIKGKRWVEQYDNVWNYRPGVQIDINYRPLFNENWIFPLTEERPAGMESVENGCYW